MDFQKASTLLGKINRLYSNLAESPDNVAPVERDLMLSYVRDLYDALLHDAVAVVQAPPAPPVAPVVEKAPEKKPEPPVKPESKKPTIVFNNDQEEVETVEMPVFETPPPPPAPPAPKATPVPPKAVVTPPVAPPPPPPAPKVEKPKEEPPVKVTPPPAPPKAKDMPSTGNADFDELFVFQEVKDIAQKLALSPIPDLKAAMSINDRIQFTSELFNGDVSVYDQAITELNGLSDMASAKALIYREYVDRFEWMEEEKRSAVKSLIKLLRRRYAGK